MRRIVLNPLHLLCLIMSAALLLAFSSARAEEPRKATPDEVCAAIIAYTDMAVPPAKLAPLAPGCAASAKCGAARRAMIDANRSDVEILKCDQGNAATPPLPTAECKIDTSPGAPPQSCDVEADNACAMASAYANMGVYRNTDGMEQMRIQASKCSKDPNPKIICATLLAIKLAFSATPPTVRVPDFGLVCNESGR
jgi:hypothetical protein